MLVSGLWLYLLHILTNVKVPIDLVNACPIFRMGHALSKSMGLNAAAQWAFRESGVPVRINCMSLT